MASTRRNNVAKYMNEWRDGSWYMNAERSSVPQKVADEVVAYSGLADTLANVGAYAQTVTAMLEDGSLKLIDHADGFKTLEVE